MKVDCVEVGLSDHGLICGILVSSTPKQQQCPQFNTCVITCTVEALVADLDAAPWSVRDNIDSRWEYWKLLLLQIIDPHI